MTNQEHDYKYFHNKLIGYFKNLLSSLQYLVEGEIPAAEAKDLYLETKRELQDKTSISRKKSTASRSSAASTPERAR